MQNKLLEELLTIKELDYIIEKFQLVKKHENLIILQILQGAKFKKTPEVEIGKKTFIIQTSLNAVLENMKNINSTYV